MLELLLKKDVEALGKRGSIVRVKPGYARNYLIPQDIAVVATKENLRRLEADKKRQIQVELAKKDEFVELAEEMAAVACNIEVNANEEGHLFGSVTYAMIAEGLQDLGYDVKEDNITLEEEDKYPIKEVGVYPIHIRLHPEVVANSKVWVVKKEQDASE